MLVTEHHDTSQANAEILHPQSRSLFRYWESARGASAAPLRADIDLKALGPLIPHLALIERHPRTGGFRWRLAGTAVCDLFRTELTGNDVLAGWDRFEAQVIGRFLSGVIGTLQPCLLRIRLRTDFGQLVGAEMLGLPVIAADGTNMQIFGGVFPFLESGSLSYRSVTALELAGARTIWTEHLPGDLLVKHLEKGQGWNFRNFQVIPGGRA